MRFGTIMLDPPWNYRNAGVRGSAELHYSTLTDNDLMELRIRDLALPDCVIIMWATMPKLDIAFGCFQSWGVEHITAFPWVKLTSDPMVNLFGDLQANPFYGLGFWVRGCSELVMIGRYGNPPQPNSDFMGLISKRLRHSRKPRHIYEFAESCPGPRIELFARPPDRRKRGAHEAAPSPDWWYLGNEVNAGLDIRQAIPIAAQSASRDEFERAVNEAAMVPT